MMLINKRIEEPKNIISSNGFLLAGAQSYGRNKQLFNKIEKSSANSTMLNPVADVVYSYKPFDDYIVDYNNKKIDVYDINTLYRLTSIITSLINVPITSWIKSQYRYTKVGSIKDMFLKSVLEALYNHEPFDPTVYTVGVEISGNSQFPTEYMNNKASAFELVQVFLLCEQDHYRDLVTPPMIISRLTEFLNIIVGNPGVR